MGPSCPKEIESLDSLLHTMLARKRMLVEYALASASKSMRLVADKAMAGERLSMEDGLLLFQQAPLQLLSLLATHARLRHNGVEAYYNRNAHIEPTNICLFRCSFCAFRRERGQPGAWELEQDEIENLARAHELQGNTEVHITGGILPEWRIEHLERLVAGAHNAAPTLHIKAFSAVELISIFQSSDISFSEGLQRLKEAGLSSIPGGGAEIFAEDIRARICPEKASSAEWLALHRTAHRLGLQTNATMLYGHIENYTHRLDHLDRLRRLQDETYGFNCFIPLKFRAAGNQLGIMGEISQLEVLRNYAIARLFLDNIPHLKAYWPMLGKENIPITLAYGVDDLDGTINDTTKIYSMAGAEDRDPSASVVELERIIRRAGFTPIERDSLYRPVSRSSMTKTIGPLSANRHTLCC